MMTAVEDSTKPAPRDQGRYRRQAQKNPRPCQKGDTAQNLCKTETEYLLPHRPELARAHFKSDDEQEHDDAEFGKMQDRCGVSEEAEDRRPHQGTGSEISQHRTETQFPKQRHRHNASGEQNHRRPECLSKSFSRHMVSVSGSVCYVSLIYQVNKN